MIKICKKRFKCVFVGESYCGKTSIILRYVNKVFNEYISNTVGCSFFAKTEKIDNIDYGLDIWDTAGQERYRSLLSMYYRESDIIFICLCIKDKIDKSINNIKYWLNELNQYNDNCSIIIVGTKSDLVTLDDINLFIKMIENNFNLYIVITSSKNDLNIDNLFRVSLIKIIEKKKIQDKNIKIEPIIKNSNFISNWCSIL